MISVAKNYIRPRGQVSNTKALWAVTVARDWQECRAIEALSPHPYRPRFYAQTYLVAYLYYLGIRRLVYHANNNLSKLYCIKDTTHSLRNEDFSSQYGTWMMIMMMTIIIIIIINHWVQNLYLFLGLACRLIITVVAPSMFNIHIIRVNITLLYLTIYSSLFK